MPQFAERQEQFKDYCLTLQVHPEADAGMIEAAYWHLAKRYNEQAAADPSAKDKLDELNEAYSVLGTPARHEEYSRLRNDTLGEGTLPKAVVPAPEPPPLAVLERQQLRSREVSPRTTGRPPRSPHN
jgi:curved DNA-binding protein CbpA